MSDPESPTADGGSPFDLDLEAAYREALRAVDATDLPAWTDNSRSDADEERNILPFPGRPEPSPPSDQPPKNESSESSSGRRSETSSAADTGPRLTPQQLLEAVLFVGGVELTAEKLASLLKGDFTPATIARTVAEVNRRYAEENRPYLVQCENDSYRMSLRPEYEPLRRRVFGLGPKEVKLAPDAIEILALVAYRQPISRVGIEELREGSASSILRQLVRRQLIALERESGDEPKYVTTARFLDLFGIGDLAELPRPAALQFK